MPNYQVHGVLEYQDISGEVARLGLPFGPKADTTTLANIAAWLAGTGGYADTIGAPGAKLTNAKLVRNAVTIVFVEAHIGGGTDPVDGAYPSVQDKLVLGYRNDHGHRTRVSIPAPMDATLLGPPNDYTADLAETNLAAFNTLATAGSGSIPALADGGGTVFGFASGGRKLQRTRKLKRGTAFVPGSGVIGVAAP